MASSGVHPSTSGEKADMARRTRRGGRGCQPRRRRPDPRRARGLRAPRPPRRGSTAREDKRSRRILVFPPASEPADGRGRGDSQGILVFPFRTTPRRSRRSRCGRPRARRARPARNRWLERALSPQESAVPYLPPGNRACGRPRTTRKSRMRPSPLGQRRPRRAPPAGSAARRERCRPGAGRAPHSWITGA